MAALIANLDHLAFGPPPERCGAIGDGGIETGAVVDGDERPLSLWLHRLEPGATLAWSEPAQDHLIYVWDGHIETDEGELGMDEALIVEHAARGQIRAGAFGAAVLHFHRPPAHPQGPARGGGRTHFISHAQIRRADGPDPPGIGYVLYADAGCETCELWLHGNRLPGGFRTAPHYHSEDEIIVVTGGELKLGRRAHGRGSVLAVDAGTRYAFTAGEDGLSIINFRPTSPVYTLADHSRPSVDERLRFLEVMELAGAG